jgi:peptidoglycan/xylan/chitin deacetylase (PgdA/CDA1 family)
VSLKHTVLRVAKAFGAFRLARFLTRDGIRILCYHGAWIGASEFGGDAMFIRPSTFRARLEFLRRHGFLVADLADAIRAGDGRASVSTPSVVITIDDGWYSTFREMLPALTAQAMPATLYCDTQHLLAGRPIPHVMARYLMEVNGRDPSEESIRHLFERATNPRGDTADRLDAVKALCERENIDFAADEASRAFAYMTPDELQEFARTPGMRVELHTHTHTLGDHSSDVIVQEITANRQALAAILERDVSSFEHFCYPSGDCQEADGALLQRLGIKSATTVVQGIASRAPSQRYLMPRLLDGDHLSDIIFEAEMSGFLSLVRRVLR